MSTSRKEIARDATGGEHPPCDSSTTITRHCQPTDTHNTDLLTGCASATDLHQRGMGIAREHAASTRPAVGPSPTKNDANIIRTLSGSIDATDASRKNSPDKVAATLIASPESYGYRLQTSSTFTIMGSESMDTQPSPGQVFPRELNTACSKDNRRNSQETDRSNDDILPTRRPETPAHCRGRLGQMRGAGSSHSRRKLDFSLMAPNTGWLRPDDSTTRNQENAPPKFRPVRKVKTFKRSSDSINTPSAQYEAKRLCTETSPEMHQRLSEEEESSPPANYEDMFVDQTSTPRRTSPVLRDKGPMTEASGYGLEDRISPLSWDSPTAVRKNARYSPHSLSPSTGHKGQHMTQDLHTGSGSPGLESSELGFEGVPDFWRNVQLDDCNFVYMMRNVRFFGKLLHRYGGGIQSLTVSSLMDSTAWQIKQAVRLVPKFCSNITELTVDFPDLTETELWRLVVSNKLQKLTIKRMFARSFESLLKCIMPLCDLRELEIHMGDEIEVDLEGGSSDLILDLGLFLRRNPGLTSLRLFFPVTADMVRSILGNCPGLHRLELDVREVSQHLTHAAFAVPHRHLRSLVLRSRDLVMDDRWLRVLGDHFPSLCTLLLGGRHAAVTRQRSGSADAFNITDVSVY